MWLFPGFSLPVKREENEILASLNVSQRPLQFKPAKHSHENAMFDEIIWNQKSESFSLYLMLQRVNRFNLKDFKEI